MLSYEQALDRYTRNVFRWKSFYDLLEAVHLELNPDFGCKLFSTTDLVEWIGKTPGLVLWEHGGFNCHLSGRTCDVINLDPNLSGLTKCFVLGHELGHYLLGHGHVNYTHIGIRRRCELHADLFACTTLWPNGVGLESAKDFLPTNRDPVQRGRELGQLAPDEALRGLTRRSPQKAKSKARRVVRTLEDCHVRSCTEVIERYRWWLGLKSKFKNGSFPKTFECSYAQRAGRLLSG